MKLFQILKSKTKIKFPPFKILYAISDFIISLLILSFIFLSKNQNTLSEIFYFSILIFIFSIISILTFQYFRLYKRQIVDSTVKQIIQIFKSSILELILFSSILFVFSLFQNYWDLESFIRKFIFYNPTSKIISRLIFMNYLKKSNLFKTITSENVIIIGIDEGSKLLSLKLLEEKYLKSNIKGFISLKRNEVSSFQDIPVIGYIDDLKEIIKQKKINSIYISSSEISNQDLHEIVEISLKHNSYIHISSNHFKIISEKMSIDRIKDLPLIRMTSQLKNIYSFYFKKSLDFLISIILIILFSPLLIFLSIVIKMTSKGPIIFSQNRVGLNGSQFRFYKFRSMTVGIDHDKNRAKLMHDFINQKDNKMSLNTKIVDDNNITKVGKIIRKYSIDELPQLFNVIKGDMSLIGPRPCTPYEYESYKEWHKLRFNSLPGCTGLWQVTSRSSSNYDEMILLDIYYNNNISFWLDFQILLKTIPAVIGGKGDG
tara:strand:- start:1571 stop:3028 length:1458 start_codon:yes stop_codon:yes gene_type:complete